MYNVGDVRARALGRSGRSRVWRVILAAATASFAALCSGTAATEGSVCPPGMVFAVSGVCIDQYEWPNRAGKNPLLGASGVPEPQDVAAGRVMDAEHLCASVGKRVCTAREWTAACRGPEGAPYPWGSKVPRYTPGRGGGVCNYDKLYRAADEYLVHKRDPVEMRYLDQSEPAGSRPECRSASGAYDMMGNAEEWVRCSWGRDGWCLAGRFWAEPRACTAMVPNHSPRWHYVTTSFRCCFDTGRKR